MKLVPSLPLQDQGSRTTLTHAKPNPCGKTRRRMTSAPEQQTAPGGCFPKLSVNTQLRKICTSTCLLPSKAFYPSKAALPSSSHGDTTHLGVMSAPASRSTPALRVSSALHHGQNQPQEPELQHGARPCFFHGDVPQGKNLCAMFKPKQDECFPINRG